MHVINNILTALAELEDLNLLAFRFQADDDMEESKVFDHATKLGLWRGPAQYFRLDVLSPLPPPPLNSDVQHDFYWSSQTNVFGPSIYENHEDVTDPGEIGHWASELGMKPKVKMVHVCLPRFLSLKTRSLDSR